MPSRGVRPCTRVTRKITVYMDVWTKRFAGWKASKPPRAMPRTIQSSAAWLADIRMLRQMVNPNIKIYQNLDILAREDLRKSSQWASCSKPLEKMILCTHNTPCSSEAHKNSVSRKHDCRQISRFFVYDLEIYFLPSRAWEHGTIFQPHK